MGTSVATIALQAYGAGTQAYGAYNAAEANRNALNSQAQADAWTSGIRQTQALQVTQAGEAEQTQSGLKYGALLGSQRASMAANGIDLGSGSATAVQASTKLLGSIDAATIQNNALQKAWNYNVAATNLSNQSTGAKAGADSISPATSGFTSLIGGASKVSASMAKYANINGTTGDTTGVSPNYASYPTVNGSGAQLTF